MSCAFLVFNFLLRHLPNGFSLHLSSPYDSFGLLRAETSVYFKMESIQNEEIRPKSQNSRNPKDFSFRYFEFQNYKVSDNVPSGFRVSGFHSGSLELKTSFNHENRYELRTDFELTSRTDSN
ncbi:9201_t:CDS:2 [Rhizophagus irregularis]|nr:9201_t:CDS:2 [Rhizophagus irregularis]